MTDAKELADRLITKCICDELIPNSSSEYYLLSKHIQVVCKEYLTLLAEVERLREAFEHYFEPVSYDQKSSDFDLCKICGFNIRDPIHTRAKKEVLTPKPEGE